jgi:hypothetical protein
MAPEPAPGTQAQSDSEADTDTDTDTEEAARKLSHARWPVQIVLFYNQQGLASFYRPERLCALHTCLARHAAHTCPPREGPITDRYIRQLGRKQTRITAPPTAG